MVSSCERRSGGRSAHDRHLASSLDGVAGYIVRDLTTNKRVATRLERATFQLCL
jgi:hypothetical protein